MSVSVLVVTFVFDLMLVSALVAGAAIGLSLIRSTPIRWWWAPPLIVLFAVVDELYTPALLVADILVEVRDPAIASFLNADGPVPLPQLLSLGWMDLATWVAQAFVSVTLARWAVRSSTNI